MPPAAFPASNQETFPSPGRQNRRRLTLWEMVDMVPAMHISANDPEFGLWTDFVYHCVKQEGTQGARPSSSELEVQDARRQEYEQLVAEALEDMRRFAEQRAQQEASAQGMNVYAPAFVPPAPPASGPPRGINPPPPQQPHLVYTELNFLLGPMAPLDQVIGRLLDLPNEAWRPDGSVYLDLSWAIKCIGHGHFRPSSATQRAILKEELTLRTRGGLFNLPDVVCKWLCEEPGYQGGVLDVPADVAQAFWTRPQ
jgi:hypothetical protein